MSDRPSADRAVTDRSRLRFHLCCAQPAAPPKVLLLARQQFKAGKGPARERLERATVSRVQQTGSSRLLDGDASFHRAFRGLVL